MSRLRSTALQDVNYWGTMAVAAGDADGMVSGCAFNHCSSACWQPVSLCAAPSSCGLHVQHHKAKLYAAIL